MHMVSEASALSGLTVRALHHYDAIGLLKPSARSSVGYRLYSDEDIRTLRRVGRYQGFGFSLNEIRKLLTASAADRLAMLNRQLDGHAAETAGVVQAIRLEIDMETARNPEPRDRLDRAGALVARYLNQPESRRVRLLSHLLVEALDLLRPLTTRSPVDPGAARLANFIYFCRHDSANVAELCKRFLDQDGTFEDRSIATIQLVLALNGLEQHEEAVTVHRDHIEQVMAHRPGTEWPETMENSTISASWGSIGMNAEWIALFRKVDSGTVPTPENRSARYELLHTAVMTMGVIDFAGYADDIDVLTGRMAGILAEDPGWSERIWAEQRFEQQKVGNAIRRGNSEAVTEAVDAYRTFLESCDWPVERIGVAYSNLGALMHWEHRHELATELFARAEQLHGLDGYGHAWFASASLAAGAPREQVTERLRKAGQRLVSADAMRIFNEDAVLSQQSERDDLLDALLVTNP